MAIGIAERRWRHAQAVVDRVSALAADATQGERQDTLFHAARQLAALPDRAPDDAQILDVLVAAAGHTCLPANDADRAIRDGICRGRRRLEQQRAGSYASRPLAAPPPLESERLLHLTEGGEAGR